jgi:hypothetical protein
MALMVLLASGEDPNYGAYSLQVRRALRSIISSQDRASGFYGGSAQGHSSMYQHGFAMLAVAEAYGVVDDRTLWTEEGGSGKGISLGESLELAVKLAVTSAKKNPLGAWRYSPDANDHDTSVSGAILMGLLGARNAGIEVPDETIDKAIKYFTAMTGANGMVGYMSPQGGSDATTSTPWAATSPAPCRASNKHAKKTPTPSPPSLSRTSSRCARRSAIRSFWPERRSRPPSPRRRRSW